MSTIEAVVAAAERLRLAMIAPDATLDLLIADVVSYGHSDGKVETKTDVVTHLLSGRYDFVDIAITDQTVVLNNGVALVRHTLEADTNDAGKPGHVKLKVLQVWQLTASDWKMIARQAVRLAIA
ncbi:nuclear transport factor 2 family protein [Variovorax sp. PAMC 28711]|uniref:nuclear transport factor 2 family protein n=1 Tax=Variovorax sp. PAMC 28711 TaxID=1795631 RepID=UPI0009EB05BA|nr:nuclear transport factor 2 family protein [Variovorax sp. PAMC 28711]